MEVGPLLPWAGYGRTLKGLGLYEAVAVSLAAASGVLAPLVALVALFGLCVALGFVLFQTAGSELVRRADLDGGNRLGMTIWSFVIPFALFALVTEHFVTSYRQRSLLALSVSKFSGQRDYLRLEQEKRPGPKETRRHNLSMCIRLFNVTDDSHVEVESQINSAVGYVGVHKLEMGPRKTDTITIGPGRSPCLDLSFCLCGIENKLSVADARRLFEQNLASIDMDVEVRHRRSGESRWRYTDHLVGHIEGQRATIVKHEVLP